jgi:AmmeMemoRadiSam system protein B
VPTVRQPAVAGAFYPADSVELESAVRGLLANVGRDLAPDPVAPAKALIVPHAGYIYSGAVAASAYRQLDGREDEITRVVLLGPSHRVAFEGLALCSADVFATPLGPVPIEAEACGALRGLPQVRVSDDAHRAEHSLEVQLPFLQCILGEFRLIPLSVGDATTEQVAAVLETLWGGDETLILISSDLSHFHDYDTARELDGETTRAIESLCPEDLDYESACGRVPTRGLLAVARDKGLVPRRLDLRNSGDTAGSRERVVGYGAWSFELRE